ncbi:MAG: helix-turn-helix transcriptional regulator [Lachnospiraceae bacterium]|nr:helix-turn-helix transcriptional regulator [Lachnospiraceae bacterium]
MKIYPNNGKSNIAGINIRKYRLSRKLTQEELATKMQLQNAEVTQKMISRVENQQRIVTDYELFIFAKALEVEVTDLLVVN